MMLLQFFKSYDIRELCLPHNMEKLYLNLPYINLGLFLAGWQFC